ncbi:DUF397 domain-containing protein [Saccharothrix ecbatanensis]|uniref:DUF397 domain-containing protein n=1 Tax=Saccharothrix ecbatanensis TaxID=1105145 RepID=UPI00161D6A53
MNTWTWPKSSRSVSNGQCVEVARPDAPTVGLRDSKTRRPDTCGCRARRSPRS